MSHYSGRVSPKYPVDEVLQTQVIEQRERAERAEAEVDRWRAEAETLRKELAALKLASETARVVAEARVSVLEAELRKGT